FLYLTSCSRNTISMEAPKLRFVRCPGCLQLLVEYPTIAVYQCGGCGTILRAKKIKLRQQ
ncbi:hypothetical protein EE612_053185, partial [Oryza sativa]